VTSSAVEAKPKPLAPERPLIMEMRDMPRRLAPASPGGNPRPRFFTDAVAAHPVAAPVGIEASSGV
jgi:hypothetical protein